MSESKSLPRAYFDKMYAESPDPWSFATSEYEAAKYRATVGLLGHRRYSRALEIGCSIGVLTEMLAPHCERLTSVDTSIAALAQARERNARFDHVDFRQMELPREFPDGARSLIVMSEVGYYWDATDDERMRELIAAALEPGGLLVLVHYLPFVADYPRTGDAVHEAFMSDARFAHGTGFREQMYRADTFTLSPSV